MRYRFQLSLIFCLILLLSMPATALALKSDTKGSEDHPLITRLSNFYIDRYQKKEFDYEKFSTNDGSIRVEGRKFVIDYRIQPDAAPPGKIKILNNYLNALKGIGAQVKLKGSYYYVFKIVKDDMETWVKVDPGNDDGKRYILTIVEKAIMEQEVVADAEAMSKGILQSGHTAVYGIYFDSGKAVIKKESEKALAEIVKLLKNNPKLKLFVVGHTDSDGSLDNNMGLSDKRAKAVVQVLTNNYGIDKTRLVSKGLGPLAPVESNRSAKGKAKNRRVELVEKLN